MLSGTSRSRVQSERSSSNRLVRFPMSKGRASREEQPKRSNHSRDCRLENAGGRLANLGHCAKSSRDSLLRLVKLFGRTCKHKFNL